MRCANCGWENPAQNSRCEKCNAPLQGGGAQVNNNAVNQRYNKTVNEADVFPEPAQGGNVCPECGYPLRPGVSQCPNCASKSTEHEPQPRPVDNQPRVNTPAHNKKYYDGTVNPYAQPAKKNHCSLTPVAQDGEDNAPKKIDFRNSVNELNRANLDEDNMTITSKVQAVLSCEDGQWYLENRSAMQTTFIQVNGKQLLNDGDVILMGDRRFIFHGK